jgi:arabinofuranosyltransferase
LEPPLPSVSPELQALNARMMRSRPVIRRPGWPVFPYTAVVRVSLWISVAVVVVLFAWGGWQRRWIADDGLIVLRTVRNLFAGNGPVFNQGERVEANTSTAWTYLMYAGSWVGGPLRMEYVALALALVLSVLGVALLMLGAARLYAPSLRGRKAIMLPAGALVYIALRDRVLQLLAVAWIATVGAAVAFG